MAEWKGFGSQILIVGDDTDYGFHYLHTGRGYGKTDCGAVDFWQGGAKYPGIEGMVTAPAYNTLWRATLPKIRAKARDFGLREGTHWDFNQKRMELDLSATKSMFYFATTDDPELLPGPNLGRLWMDEARKSPYEAFYNLQGCLRGGDWPHKCVITTTPVSKAHWLYQTFYPLDGNSEVVEYRREDLGITHIDARTLDSLGLDRLPPIRRTITRKVVETPRGSITVTYNAYEGWTLDNPVSGAQTYAAMVTSLGGPRTPLARRELFGEHTYMEGLVYDTWNRDYHVVPPSRWPVQRPGFVVAGVDFGYSSSPNVVIVLGIDGAGRFYILDEAYHMKLDQEQLVPVLRRMERQWGIKGYACDTENPQWRVFLRQHHFNALSARKKFKDTKANPSAGIGLCSSMLNKRLSDGSQGFFVNPECKHFIEGMENYVWKDSVSEVPDKKYSDCPDAFRYAAGLAHWWGYGENRGEAQVYDMRVAA